MGAMDGSITVKYLLLAIMLVLMAGGSILLGLGITEIWQRWVAARKKEQSAETKSPDHRRAA